MIETITSPTSYNEQNAVLIPSEVGIGGILRVTGDPGVMQDMYRQAQSEHRQALVEASLRPFKALGGLLVEGARNFASNVKLEAKMAAFDFWHGTNYRIVRHELIEQERRRQFEQSIGLIAVRK